MIMKFEKPELTVVEMVSENITDVSIGSGDVVPDVPEI